METDISEMGNIGMKGKTRGDRDKWRGVGDVMEIGTDFGSGGYSGGRRNGTDLSEINW